MGGVRARGCAVERTRAGQVRDCGPWWEEGTLAQKRENSFLPEPPWASSSPFAGSFLGSWLWFLAGH